MPYPIEHKAKTRARIIEKARVMFNRRGFEGVSIDDIMREAGLTRGGFYHHFRSKDELYAEAVKSFTTCNPFVAKTATLKRRPSAKRLAHMLVELYLCDETLNDIDRQCPLIALPSDVARAGLEPRSAYTQIVESMLCVFRAALNGSERVAQQNARVIINLCVGGMVIARTTQDPELRKSLRAAARAQALALLDSGSASRSGASERVTAPRLTRAAEVSASRSRAHFRGTRRSSPSS